MNLITMTRRFICEIVGYKLHTKDNWILMQNKKTSNQMFQLRASYFAGKKVDHLRFHFIRSEGHDSPCLSFGLFLSGLDGCSTSACMLFTAFWVTKDIF